MESDRNKINPRVNGLGENRGRRSPGGLHYYHNLIQQRKSVACPANLAQSRYTMGDRSSIVRLPLSFFRVLFRHPRVRPLFVARQRQIILSAPLPAPINAGGSIPSVSVGRARVPHCPPQSINGHVLQRYSPRSNGKSNRVGRSSHCCQREGNRAFLLHHVHNRLGS